MYLYSPTGTGGTHASEEKTDVKTADNFNYNNVEFTAADQTVNIPHKTSSGGAIYAVSTKAVEKQQPPTKGEYDDVHNTDKKQTQQVRKW